MKIILRQHLSQNYLLSKSDNKLREIRHFGRDTNLFNSPFCCDELFKPAATSNRVTGRESRGLSLCKRRLSYWRLKLPRWVKVSVHSKLIYLGVFRMHFLKINTPPFTFVPAVSGIDRPVSAVKMATRHIAFFSDLQTSDTPSALLENKNDWAAGQGINPSKGCWHENPQN